MNEKELLNTIKKHNYEGLLAIAIRQRDRYVSKSAEATTLKRTRAVNFFSTQVGHYTELLKEFN